MKSYGINLVLRRSEGTTAITSHIPVGVMPDGGKEAQTKEKADLAIEYWMRTHPEFEFEMVEISRMVIDAWPARTTKAHEALKTMKGVLLRLGSMPSRLNEARIAPTEAAAAVDEALDDIRKTIELIEEGE